ncbi:MAG: redoxin family protein, partial [Pseudomonadota bacterium]
MTNETETHSDRSGVTSRRISPWVALIPAGAVAVLLTLGTPLVLGTSDELPSQFVGEPAPPMAAVSIDGLPPVTDALLRTGELTLVNFWASWCGPCRVEHPNLEALANEGLRIVGLNYKDPDPNARAFLDELGNPYVAVGSVDGRTAIEWG